MRILSRVKMSPKVVAVLESRVLSSCKTLLKWLSPGRALCRIVLGRKGPGSSVWAFSNVIQLCSPSVRAVTILDGVHDAVGEDGHLPGDTLHALFELSDVWARGEHAVQTRRPRFAVVVLSKQIR